jgi:hypothetical protein
MSLIIQFNGFDVFCSNIQSNSYELLINIRNLNEESIKTAKVTLTQVNTDSKQVVQYSEERRCYVAKNLEKGRILIKVESQGYDTFEGFHMLGGPRESKLIVLGETNSRYRLIDSQKFPLRKRPLPRNKETVALFAGRDVDTKEFFKGKLRDNNILILRSGWYQLETASTSAGLVYLITPNKEQKQSYLLADLRDLYPKRPIGPFLEYNLSGDILILLNSCHVQLDSGLSKEEVKSIFKGVRAVSWENKYGASYSVTFSKDTGIELLKIAEKLSKLEYVSSVTNSIYNTHIPQIDH